MTLAGIHRISSSSTNSRLMAVRNRRIAGLRGVVTVIGMETHPPFALSRQDRQRGGAVAGPGVRLPDGQKVPRGGGDCAGIRHVPFRILGDVIDACALLER